MSSRYSQWAPTEYVPMPVDYYQQALGVNESNVQNQVDQGKQIMYNLRSINPTGKDAEALQQQIMDSINTDIEGVGKMNLKTPEALAKINNIISNPAYVSKLRQVYSMTEEAKKAQEAYTTAVKDGNERNALPYLQAMSSLSDQTGDPSAFNPKLFTGTDAIPKYVNVQEKLNDILSKIKATGRYQDQTTGQYISIKSWEGVDKNKIRQAALSQLMANTDLKDQMQRNIQYDYFMQNHRDPKSAMTADADALKSGITESYENSKNILALATQSKSAVAKKYGIPERSVDDFINKQKYFLENTENYYNLIQKNKDNPDALNQRLIMEKYVNNHVDASSDLLSYYKETLDKKANPYGLEAVKFSDALKLEQQRQHNKKEMLQYKQDMTYRTIADGTYAVDIGRTGDTSEMNEEAKTKLADGTWLTDVMVNNGFNKDQGWDKVTPTQLPLIQSVATKNGWDGQGNAVDYLKNAWQTQTAYTTGYINPKVDQSFISASVLGSPSGLDIYTNGKKIEDAGDKAAILNAFRKHSTDNKVGGTAAESAIPISTNPMNGKPAIVYHDKDDVSKITYIDLPKGIAGRFTAAAEIANTEKNLAYNNDKTILASGTRYRLMRFAGQGTPGVLAFADVDNREIATAASSKIEMLAKAMMKKAGLSTDRGIPVSYMTEAVSAINQESQNKIKTGQEKSKFIVNGVDLGVPFYILNDFDKNPQEGLMLRNLRVGTLVPVGKGIGGYMSGKTLTEKVYHDAFQTLPAKGKAMDLKEAGTDKGKGSSFSITSSIYGPEEDDDN